jgi:hypothetical protein
VLLVHQQAAAYRLRRMIQGKSDAQIRVGSFFEDREDADRPQDLYFAGEDELAAAAGEADVVISDPLYGRAIGDVPLIGLPHRALSGDLFL